jgi:glycosyltransferase involved in cell wall biosynthesis
MSRVPPSSSSLGIFGTSGKARRVVPNKAYQALACGTPLVTADTTAARELLVHEQSALLVPPGDADALATALRRLQSNGELGRTLSEGGRAAYEAQASEPVLGARWRGLVEAHAHGLGRRVAEEGVHGLRPGLSGRVRAVLVRGLR